MTEREKILNSTEHEEFLPLLPLKSVVILPKSYMPIIVGRPLSIKAVEYALKHDGIIFITAQKHPDIETPDQNDLFHHGTRSIIRSQQVTRMPNGALKIIAEGLSRAVITSFSEHDETPGVMCRITPTNNKSGAVKLEALWRQLNELYIEYARLNEKAPADLTQAVKSVQDIDYMTDTIAVRIEKLTLEQRQVILETTDLPKRILELCTFIKREIAILETEQKIRGRVQNQVEKNQREYYLNEQIKAIQKELGRDDISSEIAHIESNIQKLHLPEEALEKINKELKRLEQMPPLSSEAVVSRHYIDWLMSLPWHKETKDTIKIEQAESILNKSHAGLIKAKERIIEFLAAKKYSSSLKRSPIICLVGPPGVGKTSLAEAIAKSLGRQFVRISLGGVRDEAEIRGHRRTYIGALPGKIIQAMKRVKVTNPVILLDEIDKMSRDAHGDPAAALLEVLDPEQNKSFVDHFLEIEYDLSKVMFIATANVIENIPYPLYDRFEIISLSGYTDQEKMIIAQQFLIPHNLDEHSLNKKNLVIPDAILSTIINEYTKEAGVRQLDRVIAKLMRKTIQLLLQDEKKGKKPVILTPEFLHEWLGYPKFKKTSLSKKTELIGVATGLAWTELGGDVLEIETSVVPGKGALTLTGQLGDVMQESAQAALSYIRARSKELGLKNSFYTTKDIHLHIPEGATPKDGPSAGITICVALVSALTNVPTRSNLAMTGEITLQGRVLAVGGLKEKLLAAKQYGIETVIVPQENSDDIQDCKKEVDLSGITLVFVSNMDQVLTSAFPVNPLNNIVTEQNKNKVRVTSKVAGKKSSKKRGKSEKSDK